MLTSFSQQDPVIYVTRIVIGVRREVDRVSLNRRINAVRAAKGKRV